MLIGVSGRVKNGDDMIEKGFSIVKITDRRKIFNSFRREI
jgi:hypothetical protein